VRQEHRLHSLGHKDFKNQEPLPLPSLAELQASGISRNNVMPQSMCVSLVCPRELRLCPVELVPLEQGLF